MSTQSRQRLGERVQAAAGAAAAAANEQQIAIIERTARSINQLTSCQGSRQRERERGAGVGVGCGGRRGTYWHL